VPTTRDFQLYFYHVTDFTLAGTSGITTWATFEAVPAAAVTFEDGQHDLVANNSFAVSDEGLAFVGGATGDPSTGFPGNVRDIVWGNTFTPDPQSQAYGGLFGPASALIVDQSFDRIYNNAFDRHSPDLVASVSSPASFSNWWNVTCRSGYAPLSSSSYPGPVTCEPLSYSQDANGFHLTGSIRSTDYQGGNFWASYGDSANPYGVLPFRDVGSSGRARIGSTGPSFAGDYAPLITHSVERVTFTEQGLPSTRSPEAFQVQLTSLYPGDTVWTNATATNAIPSACGALGACVTFYVPAGDYEYLVSEFHDHGVRYLPVPSSGMLEVQGSPGSPVAIDFVVAHGSSFHESAAASRRV
jgi:hypothetical protein